MGTFTPAFTKPSTVKSTSKKAARSKSTNTHVYDAKTVSTATTQFMSKNPTPKFQPGAKTQWNSQASGNKTTKAGTVVGYVPKGANAYEHLQTKFGFTVPSDVQNLSIRFGRAISRTPRYLVRVNASGESTNPAKNRRIAQIYAVPATVIERQNPAVAKKATKRSVKKTSGTTPSSSSGGVSLAPPMPVSVSLGIPSPYNPFGR